jgi:isoamylase
VGLIDLSLLERHADIRRFAKQLIAPSMRCDVVIDQRQISLNDLLRESPIDWHGVALDQPDWSAWSRSFASRSGTSATASVCT